jgi:hypothetical protein
MEFRDRPEVRFTLVHYTLLDNPDTSRTFAFGELLAWVAVYFGFSEIQPIISRTPSVEGEPEVRIFQGYSGFSKHDVMPQVLDLKTVVSYLESLQF